MVLGFYIRTFSIDLLAERVNVRTCTLALLGWEAHGCYRY